MFRALAWCRRFLSRRALLAAVMGRDDGGQVAVKGGPRVASALGAMGLEVIARDQPGFGGLLGVHPEGERFAGPHPRHRLDKDPEAAAPAVREVEALGREPVELLGIRGHPGPATDDIGRAVELRALGDGVGPDLAFAGGVPQRVVEGVDEQIRRAWPLPAIVELP